MKYDGIVVGAGSAGATTPTRLTEDPKRSVPLLEAESGESLRVLRSYGPVNSPTSNC